MDTSHEYLSKDFIKNRKILEEVSRQKLRLSSDSRLKKLQIPKPIQPGEDAVPHFPGDVTEIPKEELGKYLGIYEAETAWVGWCIARKEIELEHANILVNFVYNRLLVRSNGQATIRKATVEADEFYVNCLMEAHTIESDLKLLRASHEAYIGYGRAISREISNREIPWGNRASIGDMPTRKRFK